VAIRILAQMGLNKTGFDADLRSSEKAMRSFASSVKGYIAGAFAFSAVTSFARSVADAADEIGDLADQTGITTEEVQRLQDLAEKIGTEFSGIQGFVTALQHARREAVLGKEDIADLFNQMQISAEELEETNPMRFLETFGRALAGFSDESQKAILEQVGGARSTKLSRVISMAGLSYGAGHAQPFSPQAIEFATAQEQAVSKMTKETKGFFAEFWRVIVESWGEEKIDATQLANPFVGVLAAPMRVYGTQVKKAVEDARALRRAVENVQEFEGKKEFKNLIKPEKAKEEKEEGPDRLISARGGGLTARPAGLTSLQQIGALVRTPHDPMTDRLVRYNKLIADNTKAMADAVKNGGAAFP
jgi:hypothetical protein